jgi:hypothetical protein
MTGQLITFPVRLSVRGARLLVQAAEDVTGKAVMGTLRVAGALGNLRPGANADRASAPPAPPAPPGRASTVADAPRNGAPSPTRPRQSRPAPPRPPRSRPVRPAPTPASTPAQDLPEPDPRIARRAHDVAPAEPAAPPAQANDSDAAPALASDRLEQEGVAPIDLEAAAPAAPDHVSADPVLVREEAEAGAEEGAGAAISVHEPWEGYGRLNARDVVARLATASTAELAAVQLYESAHRQRQTVIAAVRRELAKPQR